MWEGQITCFCGCSCHRDGYGSCRLNPRQTLLPPTASLSHSTSPKGSGEQRNAGFGYLASSSKLQERYQPECPILSVAFVTDCFNVCSVYKSWEQKCALKESCESAFEPTNHTYNPQLYMCNCKPWLRISASILGVIKLNRKPVLFFFLMNCQGSFSSCHTILKYLYLYLSSVVPLNWSSATICSLAISSSLQNGGTDLAWLGWCHPHMQTLAVLPSQLASRSHWGRNWGVSWSGEVVTCQSHTPNTQRSNEGSWCHLDKKESLKALLLFGQRRDTLGGDIEIHTAEALFFFSTTFLFKPCLPVCLQVGRNALCVALRR